MRGSLENVILSFDTTRLFLGLLGANRVQDEHVRFHPKRLKVNRMAVKSSHDQIASVN